MCRLLGVVFRSEFPAESLSELKILSEIGGVPNEERRGHRDGWGIASFRDGKAFYVGRSIRPAFSDPNYNAAIDAARHLPFPNMLVAHVRAASSGGVSLENTHPFIVDNLVFAHNGTVKGLRATNSGRAKGQTDSEQIALMLSDRLREKGSLAQAVRSVVREEIDGRDFTGAILLASDGKTLVGYRDLLAEDKAAYYSLRVARCEHSVALFQEIAVGCEGERSEMSRREMVTVTPDLKVKTEKI